MITIECNKRPTTSQLRERRLGEFQGDIVFEENPKIEGVVICKYYLVEKLGDLGSPDTF